MSKFSIDGGFPAGPLKMASPSVPSSDDWRCVNCKTVIAANREPDQCHECQCREFCHVWKPPAKAVPSSEVLGIVAALGRIIEGLDCREPLPIFVKGRYWRARAAMADAHFQLSNLLQHIERVDFNAPSSEAAEDFLREIYRRAFNEGAESTIEQWRSEISAGGQPSEPSVPHHDCLNEGAYQFVEDHQPQLQRLIDGPPFGGTFPGSA